MRQAAKTDSVQAEIISALRQVGCLVHITARLGGGFPDLLVWSPVAGTLHLLECKGVGGKLTPAEREFAAVWPVDIVSGPRGALRACGFDMVKEDER